MDKRKLRSALVTTAKVLLLSATAVFVVKVLIDNWPAFRAGWRTPRAPIVGATAALIGSYLLLMYLSQRVLRGLGWVLSLRSLLRPFFYTLLGRYIPGRFAVVVGKIYLYEKRGVPRLESVLAPAYENVLAAGGGIAASLAAIITIFGSTFSFWQIALACGALGGVAVVAHPAVTRRALSFLLRRFDRNPAVPRVIATRTAWKVSGGYVLYCLLTGAFFALLAASFYDLPWVNAAKAGAAYVAASVLGYVVVLAPSGLGVRESLLILLLKPYIAPGEAAFLAVAARMVTVVAELGLAGGAWLGGNDRPARAATPPGEARDK